MNNNQDLKNKPDAYWKQKLTAQQYHVVREKGTEAPFSGALLNNHETGMYQCVACGSKLFTSDTKFDSNCGWPSFDRSLQGNVSFHEDTSFGIHRTEVTCSRCGGHLGHLFDDGPTETGKRYCINSLALRFSGKAK